MCTTQLLVTYSRNMFGIQYNKERNVNKARRRRKRGKKSAQSYFRQLLRFFLFYFTAAGHFSNLLSFISHYFKCLFLILFHSFLSCSPVFLVCFAQFLHCRLLTRSAFCFSQVGFYISLNKYLLADLKRREGENLCFYIS